MLVFVLGFYYQISLLLVALAVVVQVVKVPFKVALVHRPVHLLIVGEGEFVLLLGPERFSENLVVAHHKEIAQVVRVGVVVRQLLYFFVHVLAAVDRPVVSLTKLILRLFRGRVYLLARNLGGFF